MHSNALVKPGDLIIVDDFNYRHNQIGLAISTYTKDYLNIKITFVVVLHGDGKFVEWNQKVLHIIQ